jgi:hypothetical protein
MRRGTTGKPSVASGSLTGGSWATVGLLAVRDAPTPPSSPVDPSVSHRFEHVRKPQARARGKRAVTSIGFHGTMSRSIRMPTPPGGRKPPSLWTHGRTPCGVEDPCEPWLQGSSGFHPPGFGFCTPGLGRPAPGGTHPALRAGARGKARLDGTDCLIAGKPQARARGKRRATSCAHREPVQHAIRIARRPLRRARAGGGRQPPLSGGPTSPEVRAAGIRATPRLRLRMPRRTSAGCRLFASSQ